MKWYKHDTNAHGDAKLERVMMKYGMEGYGLYWYCLELIGQTVEVHNLTFQLEHDAEIIAKRTGIHYEMVQEMMTYMVDLGLFESSDGIITCLKLAKRTDEYTSKIIRNLPSVRTNSGQTPDKVPPIRIEQNRKDKNRKEKKDTLPDIEGLNLEAWKLWVEYRRKAKLRKYTTDMKAKELAQLPYDAQMTCVNYSVSNEYTGLFPEKANQDGRNQTNPGSIESIRANLRSKAGLN